MNRKRLGMILVAIGLGVAAALPAWAHFGMIIPSDDMVMAGDPSALGLRLFFWHPFEGQGMDLAKPKAFFVVAKGARHDLLSSLHPYSPKGHQAWQSTYQVRRPGLYIFAMEPQPYWEPAEETYIVHYTKTVVAAYGDDQGWDQPVGLKVEIVPLSRPFGLYAGNVFQGVVMRAGKPVPLAEVEVEFFNEGKKFSAPTDYMVTQVIKADPNGVFTYCAPWPGWWGFAALTPGETKLNGKDVELGGVIWVRFYEPKRQ